MLVLSRKRDETIVINDNIQITIVAIKGDKVRVGIEAPIEVSVHRKEVYEAIKRRGEDGNPYIVPTLQCSIARRSKFQF